MPKLFQSDLAPQTSEKIYQQILNLGTSSRKCGPRGKLSKRPVFAQGKTTSEQLPLQFYNFHYNSPRSTKEDVSDQEFLHNTSPSPSIIDNVEDSTEIMKKVRATSAYARNPEAYDRNPNLFLSCSPNERKHLNNQKAIPWNKSYQALRFNTEWNIKTECRAIRRTSEIVKHRTDTMYILNGSALKLQNKYTITDGETQHLRELSRARQELQLDLRDAKDIHNKSRNMSGLKNSGTSSLKKSLNGRPANIGYEYKTTVEPGNDSQNIGKERKTSCTTSADLAERAFSEDKTLHANDECPSSPGVWGTGADIDNVTDDVENDKRFHDQNDSLQENEEQGNSTSDTKVKKLSDEISDTEVNDTCLLYEDDTKDDQNDDKDDQNDDKDDQNDALSLEDGEVFDQNNINVLSDDDIDELLKSVPDSEVVENIQVYAGAAADDCADVHNKSDNDPSIK